MSSSIIESGMGSNMECFLFGICVGSLVCMCNIVTVAIRVTIRYTIKMTGEKNRKEDCFS